MDTRRKELGEFLVALRGRHAPEEFGFPAGSRRRAPGLRREEVAQLAGISPTWYAWIEQGRGVNVSAEVLDRLAQGLHLTPSERAYLFELAGRHDPLDASPDADTVSDSIVALLRDIKVPAYLMGRSWNLLAWNKPAENLFAGWLDLPLAPNEAARNLLRFVFLRPETRDFLGDWETRARRITAEFRADCRNRLDEPAVQGLIAELRQESPDFARFWKQHDVLERQGGARTFNDPRRGIVTYQQVTLHPVDQEHIKLVLLKPDS